MSGDEKKRNSEGTDPAFEKASGIIDTSLLPEKHDLTFDHKDTTEKLKYPRSIGFIISNEFCERFSYYGMRTILVFYLRDKLFYSDDDATIIYHVFTMFVYFFPLFGAMIADSWLGKFRTIFYVSIIYAIGNAIISMAAMPPLNFPSREMTMFGLFLVALGTGGIKPCVAAFGGDQFKMPQQTKQLATFFSLFYFSINAGSVISTFVTPILRMDVQCFDEDDCYALAFGVPGLLMILSIFIFVFGKYFAKYIIKKPSGNMVMLVSKCIGTAIATRSKEKKTSPKEHWLDYAEAKHGKQLVEDTKALLRVLVLYLPLPIFWALFDQQGSRWTFQAARMDGEISDSFTLKPDQMQVINPLLILVFIPIFDYVLYPILAKCKISRPLQKLTIGGILAGVAFVVSALVELELEKTYPILPSKGLAQVRIFNGYDCVINVESSIPGNENFVLASLGAYQNSDVPMTNTATYTVKLTPDSNCPFTVPTDDLVLNVTENTANSFFLTSGPDDKPIMKYYEDDPGKDNRGYPNIRVLSNINGNNTIIFRDSRDGKIRFTTYGQLMIMGGVLPSKYDMVVDGKPVFTKMKFPLGGGYSITLTKDKNGEYIHYQNTVVEANSMHIVWLIPQYVIITMGEVMFSVTGLQFSFTQAPASMKSVLQACWLLAVAFGNLIVVIVAETRALTQANEFFLFAGLMFVDMGLFVILAMRYTYVTVAEEKGEDEVLPIPLEEKPVPALKGADNEGFKSD